MALNERFHTPLPRRNFKPIYILLFVLFFSAISVRTQSTLTDGSEDPLPTTENTQPSTSSSPSFKDSPLTGSTTTTTPTSPSSQPSSPRNPTENDDNSQAGSNSDNPPDLAGTQTTASALPSNNSNSSSTSSTAPRNSQSISSSKEKSGDKGGLSGGAVTGIIFGAIVGGVALLAAMIMYIRKLERSIAKDKREVREKQARRYNQLDHNSHTAYIPGNQPQPYEM
ncbi:hypothetical protein PTTG_08904 [Puccinia triticina 1-1 BBBD Race 1]|uniref:Uncharacterized protein n=2 Tax=Puccinia triticina TaxID=208348 RepID=A0A0C4DFD6_PUCT1|nr:uncharacterized protein PtA15_2A917 [Puccinia triticina]OAV98702.1 hypothetical protein PTTG_08904 [Puccinia triticina 1-1 BBBD Race 1]WAQ82600.1 hypothetical protein PtA15_2A917 [Puccinia triticina]